jgi:hypothetical protein
VAASATIYIIIESANPNGLNPYKYLYYIFSELPGVQFGHHPEFLEEYLPWSLGVQQACNSAKTLVYTSFCLFLSTELFYAYVFTTY